MYTNYNSPKSKSKILKTAREKEKVPTEEWQPIDFSTAKQKSGAAEPVFKGLKENNCQPRILYCEGEINVSRQMKMEGTCH